MPFVLTAGYRPRRLWAATLRAADDVFAPLCSFVSMVGWDVAPAAGHGRQLIILPFPQPRADARVEDFRVASVGANATAWAPLVDVVHPEGAAATGTTVGGGFRLAVALDFSELMNVPWADYAMVPHFEAVLADVRDRFGHGYAFLVAEPLPAAEGGALGGTLAWLWHGEAAMLPLAQSVPPEMDRRADAPSVDAVAWLSAGPVVPRQMRLRWSSRPDVVFPAREVTTISTPSDDAVGQYQRAEAWSQLQALWGDVLPLAPLEGALVRLDVPASLLAAARDDLVAESHGTAGPVVPVHADVAGSPAPSPPGTPIAAPAKRRRPWWLWWLVFVVLSAVAGLVALLVRRWLPAPGGTETAEKIPVRD